MQGPALTRAPGRIVCGRRIETNAEAMHRHEFCQWAVELKASGALLGFCGFRSWDNPQPGVQGDLLAPLRP
jgi:RimJ/RimL family protein N-acetyltransferase